MVVDIFVVAIVVLVVLVRIVFFLLLKSMLKLGWRLGEFGSGCGCGCGVVVDDDVVIDVRKAFP